MFGINLARHAIKPRLKNKSLSGPFHPLRLGGLHDGVPNGRSDLRKEDFWVVIARDIDHLMSGAQEARQGRNETRMVTKHLSYLPDRFFLRRSKTMFSFHGSDGKQFLGGCRGDQIEVDLDNFELNVKISEQELQSRLAKWQPKPPPYTKGVLSKYIKLVNPASTGAVTG